MTALPASRPFGMERGRCGPRDQARRRGGGCVGGEGGEVALARVRGVISHQPAVCVPPPPPQHLKWLPAVAPVPAPANALNYQMLITAVRIGRRGSDADGAALKGLAPQSPIPLPIRSDRPPTRPRPLRLPVSMAPAAYASSPRG